MGVTVLPSSLPSRGGAAAAASRACASRLRLNPASIGSFATAVAAKKLKRPRSCRDGEPPTKRRRAGEDAGAAAMSLEEKHGENQTGSGGREDEIEIDVYALGDDALHAIKDRVGSYLEDRARREEAPSQGKERAIGQSKDGAIKQSPPGAAPKRIPPSAPRSIPPSAEQKGIPPSAPRAAPTSIAPKPAPRSIPPRAAPKSIPPRAAPKSIPPRAAPSLPAPPKPTGSREPKSELPETAISQSPPRSTPPRAAPSLPAPPKPPGSEKSMRELLADAAEVMKQVVRRRELEKLRAAARLYLAQMVRTVEFNDPYIDPQDVFK